MTFFTMRQPMSHGACHSAHHMKWNTEQLELGLSQHCNRHRPYRQRSHRRLQRASWWFDQMRKAVDGAEPGRAVCPEDVSFLAKRGAEKVIMGSGIDASQDASN